LSVKLSEKEHAPILIVEDSQFSQILLQSLCEETGLKCEIANNGREALDLLEKKKYSLFIVDLMMPVMDGRSFITKLMEIDPDSIVMVQTAMDSASVVIETMKLGVFDYIIKPVDADQFFITIQKALDYRKLKEFKNRQIKQLHADMATIRDLQAKMLPDLKKLEGFDSAFSILPVENLSGDFLDGYMVDDDTYQVVLCDVSGHGIASSYIGFEIRSIFRTLSFEKQAPSELLKKVNLQLVNDTTLDYFFATAVVAQINIRTGEIVLSSGGHLPSLLYSPEEKSCIRVKPKGPLIGLVRDRAFEDISLSMRPGDSLLLYTDGITESMSSDKKMYDSEKLEQVYTDFANLPSIEIVHSIIDSVFSFTDYSEQEDDITVLCLKKF
jgi:serine phosphatase RsbU (regulator of sigma subunit)